MLGESGRVGANHALAGVQPRRTQPAQAPGTEHGTAGPSARGQAAQPHVFE